MPKTEAHASAPEGSLIALRSILRELSPGAPLEESLGGLLKVLSKQMGYLRVFLVIMDPESESLRLSLAHSPTRSIPVTYTPGQGVVGQVYETGKAIIIPKLSENSEFLNKAFGRSPEELQTLAFVSVPVTITRHGVNEVLGALSADLPIMPEAELA
ncbi:MAG TPA: GAF domain-containing protein, partial [Humidesulfovibrio sp.]|uniref:GAF domain-containing protein n=1 Tax=Humidesulfovibrio sp. TaxID=2910988 RepID=UPI002B871BF3